MVKGEYKDWTKYHIIANGNKWKFIREGMKRSIMTHSDRNKIIKKALYELCRNGGYLTVHYKDGTVDFIVNNWCG